MTLLAVSLPHVCAQAALQYASSWIGATYAANSTYPAESASGLAVGPDGTCVVLGPDERGRECLLYKNGQVVAHCGNTHGWGRSVGQGAGAALNTSYVYIAVDQNGDDGANANNNANGLRQYPDAGVTWHTVRRHDHSGAPKAFPTGYGVDNNMLLIDSVPDGTANSTILGVAATDSTLFVSDQYNGLIKVYDANTMAFIRQWALPRPGPLAVDSAGYLWILQLAGGGAASKLLQYDASGNLQSHQITFPSTMDPISIGYDGKNNRMLVTDGNADQNIKIYNLASLSGSPTTISATFGVQGGIYAGSGSQIGTVGPLRFNGLTGVGADSAGNIYVEQQGLSRKFGNNNMGTGVTIEGYSSAGSRLWVVYGLEYVDCAEPDPVADTEIYTGQEHFSLDWTKSAGQEWSYKGYTVNRFKYPNDPRLQGNLTSGLPWVRRYNGQLLLFTTYMVPESIDVFRFNAATDGEVAIPCGSIHVGSGSQYIWRDANGDGQMQTNEQTVQTSNGAETMGVDVDSQCGIWAWNAGTSQIVHYTCQGLDANGSPTYDYTHTAAFSKPAEFNGGTVRRIHYIPETDTMYVGGTSTAMPGISGDWGSIGRFIVRYDNWSGARSVHAGYPIAPDINSVPGHTGPAAPTAIAVAGDYVFLPYYNSQKTATMAVYNVNTGQLAGYMPAGPEIDNYTADCDTRNGVQAFQRANGEYVIFLEADQITRVTMFRWNPNPAQVFETESLAVPAYAGPDYRILSDTNMSSGGGVILDSNAVGNFITFTVPNIAAGTYDVRVRVKDFNTRGIWQLSIGRADNFSGTASKVGSPHDSYTTASNPYFELDLGNWTPGSTSDKWFQFQITSKNAGSAGYTECIDFISLIPQ